MVICVSGWFVSAMGTYALGRIAGRPIVAKLAGTERLAAAEALMERGGVPALLLLRLLPIVPFSGVGYVAGATHVPVGRFAWTSAVGAIPLIVLGVVLGSRLEHFSFTDPLFWAVLAGFAALVAISHPLTRRWQRSRRVPEPEPERVSAAPLLALGLEAAPVALGRAAATVGVVRRRRCRLPGAAARRRRRGRPCSRRSRRRASRRRSPSHGARRWP